MGDEINYGAHDTSDSIDYGADRSTDDQPGFWHQVMNNLPASAKKLLGSIPARSGIMGEEQSVPNPSLSGEAQRQDMLKQITPSASKDLEGIKEFGGHVAEFLKDPIGKIKAAFANDPLGTIANVAQAGKGLTEIAAPVASAAARGATSALAAVPEIPPVAQDVAGTFAPQLAHGARLLNRATNTARAIKKAIPEANPAVLRVEDAFDAAKAKVITSPGQAPIAGPVPQGVGEPDNFSWPSEAGKGPIEAQPQPVMPSSGLTPANGMPAPQPAPSGPLNYADTQNPDVAKTLQPGAQRVLPNGKTETLRTVPLQEIEADPGNKIYEDRVDEYQKNGYAVQPQLRWNDLNDPEAPGKFVINEGHHRILADARNGKTEITAWTPDEEAPTTDDAAANRIKAIIQPNGQPDLGQAMADLPKETRKAAADANYRASQNGEPAADAGETYKAAARATKVETLGQHLIESGFTPEELEAFPPDKLKAGLAQRIKTLGINKTGDISGDTISQVLAWMRKQKP